MYLCPTTFDVFKARHSSPFSKTSGSVGKHKVNTVSTQFSHKSICWLAPLRRKSGKQNFEQSLHSVYDERRCVLHPHCARMLNFPFCLSINLFTSTNWLALEPPLGEGVVVVIVLMFGSGMATGSTYHGQLVDYVPHDKASATDVSWCSPAYLCSMLI